MWERPLVLLLGCEAFDFRVKLRELLQEFRSAVSVVHKFEAWSDGTAHETEGAAGKQAHALPRTSRYCYLWTLASSQIIAEENGLTTPVRVELEHLARVAKVEVKDFV